MMVIRFTNAFVTGAVAVALALGSGAVLSGCKSNEAPADQSAPAEKPAAKPEAATPSAEGKPAPAGSKLSKVQTNMTPQQVQEIMGSPDGEGRYPTGKSFAPFQYSNDSGWRVEYKYKGQGRVVFTTPRYGGNMKVVRVDYDPAEDGN